jgi:hypothetical protein
MVGAAMTGTSAGRGAAGTTGVGGGANGRSVDTIGWSGASGEASDAGRPKIRFRNEIRDSSGQALGDFGFPRVRFRYRRTIVASRSANSHRQ